MENVQITESLRGFLQDFIQVKDVKNDDDIFKKKYVNSLFYMQLILFIENKFSLRVENEDMEISNFCSIDNMSKFIAQKLAN